MSRVLGIDLSSFAVDLVAIDETTDEAEWTRVELPAARKKSPHPAWERTLSLPSLMPGSSFWEDIYQVAIEAPYGSNQGGTQAILNRVVGCILGCVPERLRTPERCWIVRPDEWKSGLGLKGKPTLDDLERITNGYVLQGPPDLYADLPEAQNGRDAFCIALWARETNGRSVEASLTARAPELF